MIITRVQCQEYRNMFEEQADIYAPIIHNKSEMAQLVNASIYLFTIRRG